jgi:hypothetical protein
MRIRVVRGAPVIGKVDVPYRTAFHIEFARLRIAATPPSLSA